MRVPRLIVVAIFGLILLFIAGSARADIVKVNGGGACPTTSNQAVDICPGNGSTPWDLSTLLTVLETPNILNSIGGDTNVFLVTGLSGPSFTFVLESTGQPAGGNNDTGIANNATCQIQGGAQSLFNSCEIVDSLGQTTSSTAQVTGAQINDITFPATITFGDFSGSSTSVFELDFVSMQGTSNVVPTPEPASLTLLGTGLLGLGALIRRRARLMNPAQ